MGLSEGVRIGKAKSTSFANPNLLEVSLSQTCCLYWGLVVWVSFRVRDRIEKA